MTDLTQRFAEAGFRLVEVSRGSYVVDALDPATNTPQRQLKRGQLRDWLEWEQRRAAGFPEGFRDGE